MAVWLLMGPPRSDYLFFWDADTLRETRYVQVTLPGGAPLWHLNELEVVNGSVLANVWYAHQVRGKRAGIWRECVRECVRVCVRSENTNTRERTAGWE